jgi:hypothetical protein
MPSFLLEIWNTKGSNEGKVVGYMKNFILVDSPSIFLRELLLCCCTAHERFV